MLEMGLGEMKGGEELLIHRKEKKSFCLFNFLFSLTGWSPWPPNSIYIISHRGSGR